MFKRLVGIIVVFGFLAPALVSAATVGFAPSTGIWFSAETVQPHQTIWIYSVVVNNQYHALNGVVGFYDNNELIDSVEIKLLPKEGAKQIKVLWTPEVGNHALSAKFIKAFSVDQNGNEQTLSTQTMSGVAGTPLKLGGTPATAETTTSSATSAAAPAPVNVETTSETPVFMPDVSGVVQLHVAEQNGSLVVAPGTVNANTTGGGFKNLDTTIARIMGSVDNFFGKNREALDKAQNTVNEVASTTSKVAGVYEQTKQTMSTGAAYYGKASAVVEKIKPAFVAVAPAWEKISDNNNPKRIIIVGLIVLVVLWIIKLFVRRRRRQEYFDRP